jgi:predicted enzyme related to lactoylglutathione lyase
MARVAINIDVDDLQKGVAFYSSAIGLNPVRRFGGTVVELAGTEVPVYVMQKPVSAPPFPGAEIPRDYARHWTPVHIDFCVEDVAQSRARAEGAGARAESAIESHPWGSIVLMSDPFGNGFCLIQLDTAAFDAIATPYLPDETVKT